MVSEYRCASFGILLLVAIIDLLAKYHLRFVHYLRSNYQPPVGCLFFLLIPKSLKIRQDQLQGFEVFHLSIYYDL